jgi:hypothetical protein
MDLERLTTRAAEIAERESADLHCRVPISMVTAALGGEFEVPTVEGGTGTAARIPGETIDGGGERRLEPLPDALVSSDARLILLLSPWPGYGHPSRR